MYTVDSMLLATQALNARGETLGVTVSSLTTLQTTHQVNRKTTIEESPLSEGQTLISLTVSTTTTKEVQHQQHATQSATTVNLALKRLNEE
jgi:hypothetical protein